MKQYDVYALGHALVDIEYHCEAEQLVSMGIDKGVMTLIDEHQHNHLVNYLGDDHEKMACGGSAANTMIALAQMGGQGYFSCSLGNDITGQFFVDDLNKAGIHSNAHLHMADGETSGKCLVFVTPDADRTMNTFLGASADLDASYVSEAAIADSEYIYLEGYLVTDERSRAAVIEARNLARQHQTHTALTLSDPNMMKFFRDGMLAMIGDGVDLLFANQEEVFELTGTRDPDRYVDELQGYAKTFAVTLGADGSVVFDGEELHHIRPRSVTAIDTLAAGDMYAGAFLYGLTHGLGYREAGSLASMASAEIVTRFGPRLTTDTTLDVLKQFNDGAI